MNRFLTIVVLVAGLSAHGQMVPDREGAGKEIQPNKQAWEWDDRDRIAARVDPAAAAERLRRGETVREDSRLSAEGAGDSSMKAVDIIDGRRDPHLYLPYELFDQLVRLGFADDPPTRSAYRESKDEQRRQLGLPEDMWERLDSIVAAYRSDRNRQHDVALSGLPGEDRASASTRIEMLVCRDRYAALQEGQTQFGPAFKRFLYTAVAVTMSDIVLQKPEPERLATINGGCQ